LPRSKKSFIHGTTKALFCDILIHSELSCTKINEGDVLIVDLLFKHEAQLVEDAPMFRALMEQVNDPANLNLLQALLLAAAAYELTPEVVLDLGTGMGNSCGVFGSIAHRIDAKVYTFDIYPRWPEIVARFEEPFRAQIAKRVIAHGDITRYDFEDILRPASSVVVFWDAHGFDVAQHVLSIVLPIIADRPHVVLCHDMSDNRYNVPKSYDGKPIWGVSAVQTAYVNSSWVCTHAAQAIAILDFCWRNDVDFHSIDRELQENIDPKRRWAFLDAVGLAEGLGAHMGYFSMSETRARNFPARL
jgi:SAM-dependent methyltransferase